MTDAPEATAAPEPTGKVAEALELFSGMTVLELSEFVKAAEDKFGVQAAAPVALAAAAGAAPAGEEAEEAPSTVDVILKAAGEQKLQTIKVVRQLTSLGLKDAKALVDGAPNTVAEGVKKEDADKMKSELEAVGAKVEFK